MGIYERVETYGHEQVAYCLDKSSGLKAIIAIHSTTLGPALGGCRMWPYQREEDALEDVLRLSRGMTYKNSVMGLNLGGGKAVIIGDPAAAKSEALFRAFGRFVGTLGGRYITAEDVGTTVEDMTFIQQETDFVVGRAEVSGDPSPVTAYGVYRGIKACARQQFQNESLKGKRIAVQGTGKVGYHLCKHLAEEGARLVVTDIRQENIDRAVKDFDASPVAADAIFAVECDIFSPCAMGAVLNDNTIPQLKCKIVAGAANNQLAEPRHGEVLRENGILYAPDFVINGGGVTNVAEEFHPTGYNRDRAFTKVATIYDKLLRIFATAEREQVSPFKAAELVAEERIAAIHRLKRIYVAQ